MNPVSVKVGDKVLLPEYGGTKLLLEEQVCIKGNSLKLKYGLLKACLEHVSRVHGCSLFAAGPLGQNA